MRPVVSEYAWYFGGTIGPRILTLAALTIYTHHIDPSSYGSYSLCLAWVALAYTLLIYWIQSAIQRLYPEHEKLGTIDRLLGSAIITGLVLIAAASPLMWLAGRSVAPALALGTAAAFAGQGVAILVSSIAMAAGEKRRFAAYALVDGALKFVLGLFVIFGDLGVGWLLALPAASGGALFVFEVVRLKRRKRLSFRLDRRVVQAMSKYGLPLVVVWLGALLLGSLDRFMLEGLSSSFTLGIYSAAYPLGEAMVQVFATPMLITVATRLYARAAHEGVDTARRELVHLTALVCPLLGIVVALSLACARPITRLFLGAAYGDSSVVLPWVSAGLVFWAVGSLMAKDFELRKATISSWPPIVLATIVNAALNFLAIPRWGARGAAAATLFAYFAYFLVVGVFARSNPLRILARAWRPLLAAPVVGLVVRWAVDPAWHPVLALGAAVLMAAVGYLAALSALREPHLSELFALLRRRDSPAAKG